MVLLEAPEGGWTVNPNSELRKLREDTGYVVTGSFRNIASVRFTLADLRAMKPGEVLTATGYIDQHVVPEADFQEAAADEGCDD
jgi:hypothetical protein